MHVNFLYIKTRIAKEVLFINTCFLLLPSYIIQSYLNIDNRVFFVLLTSICLAALVSSNELRIDSYIKNLCMCVLILGVIGTYFSGEFTQVLMAVGFCVNAIIASCGLKYIVNPKALRYLLAISALFILASFIGFIYAYGGGTPMHSVTMLDGGRELHLYLTTYSDSVLGNIIRPRAIYDEPGAMAFMLTCVVAVNEATRGNEKWSWVLLVTGLITTSLTLFLIAIFLALAKVRTRNLLSIILMLTMAFLFIAYSDMLTDLFNTFFLSRFETGDGKLIGDNRINQVMTFFEALNWDMAFKGAPALGLEADQSSNPFSIFSTYGVFVWLPYAALEMWLLYSVFFYQPHLRFPALAMFLTLLQRPYIYSLYWGMMILVVVFAIYKIQKFPVSDNLLVKKRV